MKRVIILGSTGSIGESALRVARDLPDDIRVVGLCCGGNTKRLAEQAAEFQPEAVASVCGDLVGAEDLGPRAFCGKDAAVRLVEETEADIILNGISGSAGLRPSLAAVRRGRDLALANKESLVLAGSLLIGTARKAGARILPVDSEHAALSGLLEGQDPAGVAELILTASGGVVRDLPLEALCGVRFREALCHPTWKMGAAITVDSSTMANKGLEVIEAQRLFGVRLNAIHVLLHPQCIVHSLTRTADGTLHAELSTPDMRIPIQNALTGSPARSNGVDWLDLTGQSLTFDRVDPRRYPMLGLAYGAAEGSSADPVVFVAANEVARAAFMSDTITFTRIAEIVERALSRQWTLSGRCVEEILALDRDVRRTVQKELKDERS
ncbi:MAG TPA: 1-deoxy-D-xylulose-5-phosphate reductoisomerase [Spirochaetia bacterium]|nr:1-deoxy-D-xylulose-5-phosphate reductoisomerase [Spirochaetia bacterium]